jgi:hypothetical protein
VIYAEKIKILLRDKRTEIRLNFQVDKKTSNLLALIKAHLGGGHIGHRKKKKKKKTNNYYYGTNSFCRANNLIKYFDTFNILSSKHFNYLIWREAFF